jgi:hypothetical protein
MWDARTFLDSYKEILDCRIRTAITLVFLITEISLSYLTNLTIAVLDIIHNLVSHLKRNVSETESTLRNVVL